MKLNLAFPIVSVHLPITRVCNRLCHECYCKEELLWFNPNLNKEKEVSFDELVRIGKLLGKLDGLELSGGEPTLHLEFEKISINLKNIFDVKSIMLVSNGFLFGKDKTKLPLLLNYDRIWISHYTENFVKLHGGVSNTNTVNIITKFISENYNKPYDPIALDSHTMYFDPPYKGICCGRDSSQMVSCYDNKIYGCCVAWGLKEKGGSIPLTEDWRYHLQEITLPCKDCFLTGKL